MCVYTILHSSDQIWTDIKITLTGFLLHTQVCNTLQNNSRYSVQPPFQEHCRMVGINISHPTRMSLQSLNSCVFSEKNRFGFWFRSNLWPLPLDPLIWSNSSPKSKQFVTTLQMKKHVCICDLHSQYFYLGGWRSLSEFASWICLSFSIILKLFVYACISVIIL